MIKRIVFILLLCQGFMLAQHSPKIFSVDNPNYADAFTGENPSANSISVSLTVGDTIWLGTARGLSKTTDNGETWINFYGSEPAGLGISAIAYDYDKHALWIATARAFIKDGKSTPEGTGIHYSQDGGNTWTSFPQPVDADGDSLVVYGMNNLKALPITVTPQNITYDIAITPGTVWITSWSSGLRKSTDMGVTWERVVLPPDNLNSIHPSDELDFCYSPSAGAFCGEGHRNHVAFSVLVVDDTTLYVGTANGINKTTDGGVSWKKLNHQNQEEPISGNFVTSLGYNESNGTIWATTWKADDQDEFYGVSYSTNGGDTWKTTLPGEKGHNIICRGFKTIVVSDNGAFKTENEGSTWFGTTPIYDKISGISLQTTEFLTATFASNGLYTFIGTEDGLIRHRGTGAGWSDDWKIYIASTPLEDKLDAYAYPNPFSPKTESVKIKYSTGNSSQNVTIRIYDFGMNYVRTVIQNELRGDPAHQVESSHDGDINGVIDHWNGKDDYGKTVPNGVYFYRIDIGDEDPVFGKIMVLQ